MNKKTLVLTVSLGIICTLFSGFNIDLARATDPVVIGFAHFNRLSRRQGVFKGRGTGRGRDQCRRGGQCGRRKKTVFPWSPSIFGMQHRAYPFPKHCSALKRSFSIRNRRPWWWAPFRSEALIAGMDLIAKYEVPMIGTIAVTPASEAKIKEDPAKYKYIFRTCLNAKYLVKYLAGTMSFINEQFGFNKVYIMNQDVAWARATADITTKMYFDKAGWTVVGHEAYPTGTSDFSSALMKNSGHRRPGNYADFRHAPERHLGQAVEQHEGARPDGRIYLTTCRTRRVENL